MCVKSEFEMNDVKATVDSEKKVEEPKTEMTFDELKNHPPPRSTQDEGGKASSRV